MNFPIWEHAGLNGGMFIAIIAIIHVFVAQFAVGGGFFLVLAERRALRCQSTELLEWVKGHSKFFLLLTMVFGALTGVAIWCVITLISPQGTRLLLSNYVFGWAAEWTFFLGEIIALLFYSATFKALIKGKMPAHTHMAFGLLYAVFAFLSLFIINGIITFMLTPGDWIANHDFWSGFFNPTFWPSLVFRFSLCLLLAGLFAICACLRIKTRELRESTLRWCALMWVLIPFVVMALSAVWYLHSLPEPLHDVVMFRNTMDLRPYVRLFSVLMPFVLAGALLLLIKLPNGVRLPMVLVVVIVTFGYYGSFEWIRESTRRPWVIYNFTYSNGLSPRHAEVIAREGFMAATGGWSRVKTITSENMLQAGAFIFGYQCSNCHAINGPKLDIVPRVRGRGLEGIEALITGQGKIRTYMPPFMGNADDKRALAAYLEVMSAQRPKQHKEPSAGTTASPEEAQ